jgi:MoaA/NifB/PqqE/SkfB family radical SAM enzyme
LLEVLNNTNYARIAYLRNIEVRGNYKIHQFCIHTTVTAQNLDQVSDIKKFCGDDIYFSAEHIAKVGEANSNPEIYGEDSDYLKCKTTSSGIMEPMVITKTECGNGACCLFYYGIAIGYEGEIMLDTHAVETRGSIGNINNESLENLIKKSKLLKKDFFEKFKGKYCLIRDDNYQNFLKHLKSLRG